MLLLLEVLSHERPRHLGNRVRVLSQAIRQAIDRKLTDLDLTGQQSFILRYLSERKDEVVYPKDIEALQSHPPHRLGSFAAARVQGLSHLRAGPRRPAL